VQLLNRPRSLYTTSDGGIDALIRGISGQSIQQYDRFVTDQVTVHLFAEHPPRGVGTDLVSLNIQRGRDHGIPGTTLRTNQSYSESTDLVVELANVIRLSLTVLGHNVVMLTCAVLYCNRM